jgi:hypothetical protein
MMRQLGSRLVYLDEAHTRGTDLPFPLGSRAMVTLGPKLVKGKLAQGSIVYPHRYRVRLALTRFTAACECESSEMAIRSYSSVPRKSKVK